MALGVRYEALMVAHRVQPLTARSVRQAITLTHDLVLNGCILADFCIKDGRTICSYLHS